MEILSILQIVFDAVLLFGILFLFHYSVQHSERKKEDADILKDLKVQEIKEGLQEMLLTLKQLGKEVSDNLQEKVKEAEDKTEKLRKTLLKLDRDLGKVERVSQEVEVEKDYLESKKRVLDASRSKKRGGTRSEAKTEPGSKIDGMTASAGVFSSGTFPLMENQSKWTDPLVLEVYRLSEKRMEIAEIAKKTRLSRAEVQLILDLRGNRFTTPN